MRRRRCLNSTRMVGGCLRFSLSNLPPRTDFVVRALGEGNPSLEHGDDSVDYIIFFRPPLPRQVAHRVKVGVTYCGEKEQTAPSPYLFHNRVLPSEEGGQKYSLRKGYLDYELFETHQLRTYNNGATIGCMYMSFENNYIEMDRDVRVCIELKVDMNLRFMPQNVPGSFLMWFPPDVDPAEHGLKIDIRLIPQRTPPWFKARGFSGTKSYMFIGFWVPKPDSKEGKEFHPDKKGTFNNFARAAMRLGTITEESILMAYLLFYPRRKYEEMGWCPAPSDYPRRWGASPDGLFIDPDVTWEQVKYPRDMGEKRGMDITQGVCEFKTSRRKTSMEAYFIPQLYMEMIALNVAWADLVRYKYERFFNKDTHQWEYRDVGYVYRFYRDPKEEAELVELWKYATNHRERLPEVVHKDSRFIKMRQRLEKQAREMEPVDVIHMTPETVHLYEKHRQHREHLVHAAALRTPQEMEATEDDLMWTDLNERHQKLLRLDETKDVAEMVALLVEQAETCSAVASQLIRGTRKRVH